MAYNANGIIESENKFQKKGYFEVTFSLRSTAA